MRRFLLLVSVMVLSRSVVVGLDVRYTQSECLRTALAAPAAPAADAADDAISVQVKGCSIVVSHLNVVTNCCLDFQPKVEVVGSSIRVEEVDVGPPCDCMCPFNLEITIADLEPGRYTLEFYKFYQEEPLTYEVTILPCTGYWIIGAEVWASMGVKGVVVPVSATNERPLQGFSFGTTFPLLHALMAGIHFRHTITEAVGAEFVSIRIDNGDTGDILPVPERGWATCSVILDWQPPFDGQTIPPGAGQRIGNLVYDILPPAGSVPRSISVPLVGGLGKPPVPLVFTVNGQDVIPEVQNGIIQLSFPPVFIRGDANDNGLMSISDPIYLLEYLFRGGPVPPCDDSADANDDGDLDIADAVTLLLYLFAGGSIPPPSPPGPPGHDPTLDTLDCLRRP